MNLHVIVLLCTFRHC